MREIRIYIIILFLFSGNKIYCQKNKIDTLFVSSKDKLEDVLTVGKSNKFKTVVYFKNDGIYTINRTVDISSDLEIVGNGSTLRPVLNWSNGSNSDSPLFSLIGKKNVQVKNLIIDFQGNKRDNNRIYCGFLILGSSFVTIENINFKNGGSIAKATPNSPYILIASQDFANDLASLPQIYKSIVGSSNNNIVRNNVFDNSLSSTRFGIRVLSNWSSKRPQENFVNRSYNNLIEGNQFIGEFAWNTVELAGGGTVQNRIFNNYIRGQAVNMLDIDKGASYNIIEKNTIENSGLPKRYKNDVNVRCSPISVQGTLNKYYSLSNQVLNNTIRNISNPQSNNSKYYYSSAIMTSVVKGVIIRGNIISNIYQDGNYQNGKVYGFGIAIHDFSNNVNIESNEIDRVNVAIGINWQKENGESITIKNNKIDFARQALKVPNNSIGRSKLNVINNSTKNSVK